MAYTSMEGSIILKGTRHGLLASVREDVDWNEVLREIVSVATQGSDFLKEAQLVLDFGWRELSEEQFDSIIATLTSHNLGCNGILSTSLNTRTIAESRGYRAIIGRLGLAQHQGRRLRREQAAAPPVAADVPVVEAVSAPEPSASGTATPVAAGTQAGVTEAAAVPTTAAHPATTPLISVDQAQAASLELIEPTISSGLVIAPVIPSRPSAEPTPTQAPHTEDSLDAFVALDPPSTESGPASTFDSADPVVANLPAVFDSSESEGVVYSSSQEVPHFQDEEPTLYLRKTLRSGQKVVFAGNVVLLGDLNPGAQIEADGDVIILGQLRGSVHAGCEGDRGATVITSSFAATQLRIAERFYKSDDGHRFFKKSAPVGTLRARLDGDTVVLEALSAR